MKTHFIEATNVDAGGMNWGKFAVAQFEPEEWQRRSGVDASPLLRDRGWRDFHIMVVDLQTGEGAIFRPGGSAKHDLDKHKVWVCPMFEPFLRWLYQQDLTDLSKLPSLVKIDDPRSALAGYRRPGPAKQPRVCAE